LLMLWRIVALILALSRRERGLDKLTGSLCRSARESHKLTDYLALRERLG
jgi:hypothetical protein